MMGSQERRATKHATDTSRRVFHVRQRHMESHGQSGTAVVIDLQSDSHDRPHSAQPCLASVRSSASAVFVGGTVDGRQWQWRWWSMSHEGPVHVLLHSTAEAEQNRAEHTQTSAAAKSAEARVAQGIRRRSTPGCQSQAAEGVPIASLRPSQRTDPLALTHLTPHAHAHPPTDAVASPQRPRWESCELAFAGH